MTTPPGLIDPAQFPFRSASMDVPALERAAGVLRRLGSGVSDGADDLAAAWDGLRGGYEAPEQDRVYRLMGPVTTSADSLETDLSTAAGHLDDFAETLGVLRVRLMVLEQEAQTFRDAVVDGVSVLESESAAAWGTGYETVVVPWDQDTDTTKENKRLVLEHAKLVEDITTASADCHNKLMDLVPGAEDSDDLVGVAAEVLMDPTESFPWGMPVAEDRNWRESIDHGAYSFVFNLYAGAAALAVGYDASMGERSNSFWGQAWVGFGNTIMSMGVTAGAGYLTSRNPVAATWVLQRLPAGAQRWYANRQVVAAGAAGSLVGIDYQEHLAGGDGFWRWREDGIATGTESVLNIGSMFVPAGGIGSGAVRTGWLGARLLRVTTGSLDVVVPGSSLAVQSGIRVVSGLRTAVHRLDEGYPVIPSPVHAVGDDPGLTAVDDPHVQVLADIPVSEQLFGDGGADRVHGTDPADVPAVDPAAGSSSVPEVNRSDYATTVAQTQGRHVLGSSMFDDASYFTDSSDAQAVLDAFHDGSAEILGFKANGDVVVRVEGVTGYNQNLRYGFVDQPTSVFFIKGTVHPSVVPYNPTWAPR